MEKKNAICNPYKGPGLMLNILLGLLQDEPLNTLPAQGRTEAPVGTPDTRH